jgi:hypothetical protein
MIDPKLLASMVADVPDQDAVYVADLGEAVIQPDPTTPATGPTSERVPTPEDRAIDGVAYHVFNTLRGTEDTVDGATFADIRAIIVAERAAV